MKKILPLLFFAFLAAVAVAVVAFVFPAYSKNKKIRERDDEITTELKRKKVECLSHKQKLSDLEHNPKEVEKIAREKFNYCKDSETVYKFSETVVVDTEREK